MKERVDVWTDKRNNGHVTSLCSALRTASSIRLLNEKQQVRIIRFNKRRKPFSPLWRTSSRHNQRITNTCVNKRNRNAETSQIKFNRTLFLCARTALVISQSQFTNLSTPVNNLRLSLCSLNYVRMLRVLSA